MELVVNHITCQIKPFYLIKTSLTRLRAMWIEQHRAVKDRWHLMAWQTIAVEIR